MKDYKANWPQWLKEAVTPEVERRLGDLRWGDVRLGDVRLGDLLLGDVRLADVLLGDVRLCYKICGLCALFVDKRYLRFVQVA